jgi:hypothetical protein
MTLMLTDLLGFLVDGVKLIRTFDVEQVRWKKLPPVTVGHFFGFLFFNVRFVGCVIGGVGLGIICFASRLSGFASWFVVDVFRGDLDVIDKEVVEVDCSRKVGTGNHLAVDNKFEMVGTGRQLYARKHAWSIFPVYKSQQVWLFREQQNHPRVVSNQTGVKSHAANTRDINKEKAREGLPLPRMQSVLSIPIRKSTCDVDSMTTTIPFDDGRYCQVCGLNGIRLEFVAQLIFRRRRGAHH